jgi:hypothetical protein
MILKNAKSILYRSNIIKKIYLGAKLIYNYVIAPPPVVSEENIQGSNSAETYKEGSETWGDLTLSSGCEVSQDGVEIQDEETYLSSEIHGLSYPMSFEFKGRLDSECYKLQAYNPGMLFGLSPTENSWATGITCYSTTDYGIIVDTTGAMTICTYKTPTYVHIVITVNETGNLTMYMNGIDNKWTANANSAIMSEKKYIYNGQGEGRFVGAINTMRWWDVALSEEEIRELFSEDGDEYTLKDSF